MAYNNCLPSFLQELPHGDMLTLEPWECASVCVRCCAVSRPSQITSSFHNPHREEEPCQQSSSSPPLVTDKESPGEKGR